MAETSRLASGESTHPVCVLVCLQGIGSLIQLFASVTHREMLSGALIILISLKKKYFLTLNFNVFDV